MRLNTVSEITKRELSIASVNRELALLRRIFNIAVREGWIYKNPINAGESLISTADEKKRTRIITKKEELSLLECCDHPRRQHLKPILICALDSGMRRGEIFSLTWRDIDFENDKISICAFNSKTETDREVPITPRLRQEFTRLWENSEGNLSDLVFNVKTNVKRSFTNIRRLCGLEDVRFHDLRHTAATRLVRSGLPIAEVGRILGHTQLETSYRYVNANEDTLFRAREAFINYQESDNESMHLII